MRSCRYNATAHQRYQATRTTRFFPFVIVVNGPVLPAPVAGTNLRPQHHLIGIYLIHLRRFTVNYPTLSL